MSQAPEVMPGKQSYHTPELSDYGTVRELTQGSTHNINSPTDNDGAGDNTSISLTGPRFDGIPIYITGGPR
jgi:hypothetical protein